MNKYNTKLGQLLSLVLRPQFESLVKSMEADKHCKKFSAWQQFVAMCYAQNAKPSGLRNLENSLNCNPTCLYHLGIHKALKRSAISYANNCRSCILFEKLFYSMQRIWTIIFQKGFFILHSQLFGNVLAKVSKDNSDLNEKLEKIFKEIESSALGSDSEDDFKGLFDDIGVNSNNLGPTVTRRNEMLVKLMNGIASMSLGNGDYSGNSIDAFGDAYEYLIGMYASNAGKSGGEYYTPQEASVLLTKITLA